MLSHRSHTHIDISRGVYRLQIMHTYAYKYKYTHKTKTNTCEEVFDKVFLLPHIHKSFPTKWYLMGSVA